MKNIDKEILALLDKYGGDTKRALKENKRLDYLYALAGLRENLLEWYDFKEDGRLLQVGADYGALTGLFSQRVREVTVLDPSKESLSVVQARWQQRKNVSYVCGALEEYAGRPKCGLYDYVTIIGSLSSARPLEEQLAAAKALLAPGGVLLVAARNRFGLKYLAGAGMTADGRKDSQGKEKGRAGDSQSGAREEAAGGEATVTKRQLEQFLPGGRFYYPMPDYLVPNEIYSDSRLPGKGDLTGALAVYDYPRYLLMDVGAAYDAACEDGQFDNFANSYLVVWTREGDEKEGSLATV